MTKDLVICSKTESEQFYKNEKTSPVYDCTVEDAEYIYNTLSLLVTLIRHLVVVITLP